MWYYTHVKNKYVDASGVGIASMTRHIRVLLKYSFFIINILF
nr:MAG TPA: hypothetical protein [Caudoviricetes sp.]